MLVTNRKDFAVPYTSRGQRLWLKSFIIKVTTGEGTEEVDVAVTI
jgi:hypothetical protein